VKDRGENDVASVMPVSKNSLRVNGGMEIGWFFVSSPVQLNPVGGVESQLCALRFSKVSGCLGAKMSQLIT